MHIVNQSTTPQVGDVAVAVVFRILIEVVLVACEIVASAKNGIGQTVIIVVFQVVALIEVIVICLPLHGAYVSVIASAVKAVRIVQLFLKVPAIDACQPAVYVIRIGAE